MGRHPDPGATHTMAAPRPRQNPPRQPLLAGRQKKRTHSRRCGPPRDRSPPPHSPTRARPAGARDVRGRAARLRADPRGLALRLLGAAALLVLVRRARRRRRAAGDVAAAPAPLRRRHLRALPVRRRLHAARQHPEARGVRLLLDARRHVLHGSHHQPRRAALPRGDGDRAPHDRRLGLQVAQHFLRDVLW